MQDSPAPSPGPPGQQPARLQVMLVVGRLLLLLLLLLQVAGGTAVARHAVLRRWGLSPWGLLQHQPGRRWRPALPAFRCLQDRMVHCCRLPPLDKQSMCLKDVENQHAARTACMERTMPAAHLAGGLASDMARARQ